MNCHPKYVLLDVFTPRPGKIYLTPLTIKLSPVVHCQSPCHRTVGDGANRGLQNMATAKRKTDVQEADVKE